MYPTSANLQKIELE